MAAMMFNGYEKNDYVSKSGVEVRGYTLYLCQEIDDKKGFGYKPVVKWDSVNKRQRELYVTARVFEDEHFDTLMYGDKINLICDYSGRITGFNHAN